MNRKIILGYAVGPIGSGLLGFVTLPIITWFYSPEDIGRITMLQIYTNLVVLLFCLGLDQFYVREYHETKNKALLLNLPIMKRKWNRIIDNRILKSDKYLIVKDLLNNNKSVNDIINNTGFSKSLIYKVKKELGKSTKLQKDIVLKIRDFYFNKNYTQIELSKMFNIKPGNINKIIKYKTWKNV